MDFPGATERHFITGKTGTGKTVFGVWCLSLRDYDERPWIIIDAKHDPLFRDIRRAVEIGPTSRIPSRAGLYIVRPSVNDLEEGVMTEFLYRVWSKENTGLFFDEGYAFRQRDRGVMTVLTQGRSKHIPVIALAQRPVDVSRYFMSEAEYFSVFHLQTPSDLERIGEWLPRRAADGEAVAPELLPDTHSWWYGAKKRELCKFGPCPPPEEILDTFDRRIPRRFVL